LILGCLSGEEGRGIPSVEVKFVDIGKNTGGEGGDLVLLLTLKRGEQTGLDTLVVHAVNDVRWMLGDLVTQCRS
jgi:tetrahydromethanopterin S-methyltransferase subunit D